MTKKQIVSYLLSLFLYNPTNMQH